MGLERFLREFMAPATDPRQAYRDAGNLEPELLESIRTALENIALSRRQLETRTAQLRLRLPELEEEARRALQSGRRDVARHVLERRQLVSAELTVLERQLHDADAEADRLALVEQQLAARIEALVARERMAEARQSAAQAQVRVGEALAGISDELQELGPDLARAEEQAEELEARAAAIDRLLDAGSLSALEIEAQLEDLERGLSEP